MPGSVVPTETLKQGEHPKLGRDAESYSMNWLQNIRDNAVQHGMALGWRWRADQINRTLKEQANYLDKIYTFSPFMAGGHVLMPSIDTSENEFAVRNMVYATSFQKRWRQDEPARVVSIVPNWRQYLLLPIPPVEKLNKAVLPKTAEQKKVWKEGEKEGWKEGMRLADINETRSLRVLQRSILGRIRYMELLHDGKVAAPVWAIAQDGTRVRIDSLTLGAKRLMITRGMLFNPPDKWRVDLRTAENPANRKNVSRHGNAEEQ